MINMKKVIAVILAMVLALSCTALAFAEDATTVSTLVCPICGKIYGRADSSAAIEAYNTCLDGHRNANGYFQCLVCGKEYDNPDAYVACQKSHDLENTTYTCETCGAKFSTKAAFNDHLATHYNNVNYHWDKYVGLSLPDLMDKFMTYVQTSGIITLLQDLFWDLYNKIMNGSSEGDVAGAVDKLDASIGTLGLPEVQLTGCKDFINAIKQKIKNLYSGETETEVEEVTYAEAPVETGSASAGIAAFAVISAAAAAAYVCSKKKA